MNLAKAQSSARRRTRRYNATILSGNGHTLIKDALAQRPWWTDTPEGEEFDLWWGGNGQAFDWSNGLTSNRRQLVNKFSKHREICIKSALAINLRRCVRALGTDLDDLVPLTCVITAGTQDHELTRFHDASARLASQGRKSMWIVKPGNGNRGLGIEICSSAKAVHALLKRKKAGTVTIVQQYMERPLLLRGRKFDIRQFVLVTPDLRVFAYRDSYVRTCSTAYDAHAADKSAHLTNDYVQKFLDTYGEHEDANKLSFDELQQILDTQPLADGRVLRFDADIWPGMMRCVQAAFACALPHYATAESHGKSFELYGLDFLVDADGKPFLLEGERVH